MTDVVVVGSGPGGVNAAAALVAAGRRVLMLDVGRRELRYAPLVPAVPFPELRRTDPAQHRYFLGDELEGVPFGPVKVGAQLTPPRQYIGADDDPRLPVDSDGFAVVQSLARGGLGAGWGAGVFPFDDVELRDMGLGLDALAPHYDRVVERIGVAGPAEARHARRGRRGCPTGGTPSAHVGAQLARLRCRGAGPAARGGRWGRRTAARTTWPA